MKYLSVFRLATLALGIAIPSTNGDENSSALRFEFSVEDSIDGVSAVDFWKNHKRNAFEEDVVNFQDVYFILNAYLGSNKQKVLAILDTGSSDFWVPSFGYNPNISGTSENTGLPFSASYYDGTRAQGEYYLDEFRFDDGSTKPALAKFQFGVSSTGNTAVLGVGNKGKEVATTKYDNLPWALKEAGTISSASYSLYLTNTGTTGSIVFGGVDTEKFEGCLTKYPISTSDGPLSINLESVSLEGKEVEVNSSYLLDSGTSLGYASQAVMRELDVVFNTTIERVGGVDYRLTSCEQPSDKFVYFEFGHNNISIAYSDFIAQNDDGTCILGLAYGAGYQILGGVFLRNAYVHFDLSDQTIALAQSRHSNLSNIVTI